MPSLPRYVVVVQGPGFPNGHSTTFGPFASHDAAYQWGVKNVYGFGWHTSQHRPTKDAALVRQKRRKRA